MPLPRILEVPKKITGHIVLFAELEEGRWKRSLVDYAKRIVNKEGIQKKWIERVPPEKHHVRTTQGLMLMPFYRERRTREIVCNDNWARMSPQRPGFSGSYQPSADVWYHMMLDTLTGERRLILRQVERELPFWNGEISRRIFAKHVKRRLDQMRAQPKRRQV